MRILSVTKESNALGLLPERNPRCIAPRNMLPTPLPQPSWSGKPIVLVGLMGVGKTTIGRRLAQRLGLPFVDADAEIETAAGMTVADIFERFGEAHFRDGERRVIARLIDGTPKVIATGGGAFMQRSHTRADPRSSRWRCGSTPRPRCSPTGSAAATPARCCAAAIPSKC